MHCPWCGTDLSRDEQGNLGCVIGNMWLSKRLEQELHQVFEEKCRSPRSTRFDGMIWYCAGCGEKLIKDANDIARCPNCQHTMGEFSHSLIEFHPHDPPTIRDERFAALSK
jgi:uncharacterized Zn finger protein (UPF0148 family)